MTRATVCTVCALAQALATLFACGASLGEISKLWLVVLMVLSLVLLPARTGRARGTARARRGATRARRGAALRFFRTYVGLLRHKFGATNKTYLPTCLPAVPGRKKTYLPTYLTCT